MPLLAGASRLIVLIAAGVALGGCLFTDSDPPTGDPSFYRSLAQANAQFDAKAAQSMISGYRRNNGLGAVTLDPALMRLAEEHARSMAASNRLDHDLGRSFPQRLKRGGYDAKFAAENIGAGYHTIAEAFSGWRDSSSHRANMLLTGATRMGIAAVYSPNSKYKVFWTLILAAPDDKPPRMPARARASGQGI
jgi:uncharacterized protein YkwD